MFDGGGGGFVSRPRSVQWTPRRGADDEPRRGTEVPTRFVTLSFSEGQNHPWDSRLGPHVTPDVTLADAPAGTVVRGHVTKCQGPQGGKLIPIHSF